MESVKGNPKPVYKSVDYTGRKIGKWTVLGFDSCKSIGKKYYTKWKCICECGSEHIVLKANLLAGKSNGCSSCAAISSRGVGNGNWRGDGNISGSVWYRVLYGASSRGISVEITTEDLQEAWLLSDSVCALSGLPIELGKTASLDRIDSSICYRRDNIQWVHKDINRMKNKYDQSYFIQVCKRIADKHTMHQTMQGIP